MSVLSDYINSGGGGGFKPFKDFGTVTGTITLNFADYSSFRVIQGDGDLEILVDKSDPELRAEGDLFFLRNLDYNVTIDSAFEEKGSLLSLNSFDGFTFVPDDSTGAFSLKDRTDTETGGADVSGDTFTNSTEFSLALGEFVSSGDVSGQVNNINDIAFNDDGSKMYIVDLGAQAVHEYDLSTPFDATTLSFNDSLDVSTEDAYPQDVAFNGDGTKMFLLGLGNASIFEYDLSTAYDVSTATHNSNTLDVSTEELYPSGFAFRSDGRVVYVVGRQTSKVYSYNIIGSNYEISTGSYSGTSIPLEPEQELPASIEFNSNGTRMFIIGPNEVVNEYTLSKGFELSTASLRETSTIDVSDKSTTSMGLAFNNDGDRMYVGASDKKLVLQYDFPVNYDTTVREEEQAPGYSIEYLSYEQRGLDANSDIQLLNGFTFGQAGTKIFLSDGTGDAIFQYELSTAYDLTTASYSGVNFPNDGNFNNPRDVKFNDDGTRIYIFGGTNDTIYQYDLSSPYDISSPTLAGSYAEPNIVAFGFNPDGTKAYFSKSGGSTISQNTLSTPFDISSASYDGVDFDSTGQGVSPIGFTFNSDGSKFYIGSGSKSVLQYSLSTNYDISTYTYDNIMYDASGEDIDINQIEFSDDGSRFFISSSDQGLSDNEFVHQYNAEEVVGYDISEGSYSGDSFPFSLVEGNPYAVNFADNGFKVYVSGRDFNYGYIFQYSLSTAYDITTISYDNTYLQLPGNTDSEPVGVIFVFDNDRFFLLGQETSTIYQFDLSNSEDISTASYNGVSLDVSTKGGTLVGGDVSEDGTKLYIQMASKDQIHRFTLTSGYDLATAVDDNQRSFQLDEVGNSPKSMIIDPYGKKVLIGDGTNDLAYQMVMQDAYDISTLRYEAVFLDTSNEAVSPGNISVNDDGTKFFSFSLDSDTIYSYDIPESFKAPPAPPTNASFVVAAQDDVPVSMLFKPDGKKMYMLGNFNSKVFEYNLLAAFDISTATYNGNNLDVSGQDDSPSGMAFNGTGTRLYVVGVFSDKIHEYQLSTPYDITSASYNGSNTFDVSGQDGRAEGLDFNDDGSKMYLVGRDTVVLYEYDLSTNYDITTATYNNNSFDLSGQVSTPQGVNFTSDGKKMFIVGGFSGAVHQYSLQTGFDITSATYDNVSINLSAQDTNPTDIKFNPDRTIMYMIGTATDTIYQYLLPNGFEGGTDSVGVEGYNINKSSYSGTSFDVQTEADRPTAIAFNEDGTKMFVADETSDAIYQYSLSTAYDVASASYDSVSLDVSTEMSLANDFHFYNNGNNLIVFDKNSDTLFQYSLGSPYDLTNGSYDSVSQDLVALMPQSSVEGYKIHFFEDGAKMIFHFEETVELFTLSTPYDITTLSNEGTDFSLANENLTMVASTFKPDGLRMITLGVNNSNPKLYQYSLTNPYDVSSITYDGIEEGVSASGQTIDTPRDVHFNNDGTLMYIIGNDDAIHQFEIGVADAGGDKVSSQDSTPESVVFNNDGSKLFMVGSSGSAVYEYSLSTAYDTSTLSFQESFDVSAQETSPKGLAFNNDGSKMYIVGVGSNFAYQYSMTTNFDISTASYDSVSADISNQDTDPNDITFNDDGSKMYIVGASSDAVHQYDLPTPFDMVQTNYGGNAFSFSGQDTDPTDIAFNSDGSKMLMVGTSSKSIHEYSLSTPYDILSANYDQVSFDISLQDENPSGITFNGDDSKVYIVGTSSAAVYQFEIQTSGAVSYDISDQDVTATGLFIRPNGKRMFMVGNFSSKIYQYDMSTAFALATMSYNDVSLDVSAEDDSPSGMAFNDDGSKLYMVGVQNDKVHQYRLSTAYNLSSASYDGDTFDVSSEETQPEGMHFNPDGTKMYILGRKSIAIHQYSLSSAFDITSAFYTGISLNVSNQAAFPHGIDFNSDGSKMFMVGGFSGSIHQYSLTTPYDLSTAEYDNVQIDISSEDTNPTGIVFDPNRTRLFMVGTQSDSFHQYAAVKQPYKNRVNRISQFGNYIGIKEEDYDYEFV